MPTTVRQQSQHRKSAARIGPDTYCVRLTFRDAPASILCPDLPHYGFEVTPGRECHNHMGVVWASWKACLPRLKIRLHAHELETWTSPDDDVRRVSGKIDVTWEMGCIQRALDDPTAPIFLNDRACTSSEAGSIYISMLADVREALELGDLDVELLQIDVFADFQAPDHRSLLDAFARLSPKVHKASSLPVSHFIGGTVTHRRYKGNGKTGQEETRLYPRGPKVAADLAAVGLGCRIEPGSELALTLRIEGVHGKMKKGGCRPLKILDDYSARPLRAGDEDVDDHGPTLSILDSLDPKIWAGIILQRLKEHGLYGIDAKTIEVSESPHDLRRLLLAAGISRGTAHQYASLIFEGEDVLREEGCDVSKIRKKVESVMGKTFVSKNNCQAQDPFSQIIDAAASLAKAGRPDPALWTRRRIFLEDGAARTPPLVMAPCRNSTHTHELSQDMTCPQDSAHPQEGEAIVGGANQTHVPQVIPLSAGGDSGHVTASGSANRRNVSSSTVYRPRNRAPSADEILAEMCGLRTSQSEELASEEAPAVLDPLLACFATIEEESSRKIDIHPQYTSHTASLRFREERSDCRQPLEERQRRS